jgi:hypothetical protein
MRILTGKWIQNKKDICYKWKWQPHIALRSYTRENIVYGLRVLSLGRDAVQFGRRTRFRTPGSLQSPPSLHGSVLSTYMNGFRVGTFRGLLILKLLQKWSRSRYRQPACCGPFFAVKSLCSSNWQELNSECPRYASLFYIPFDMPIISDAIRLIIRAAVYCNIRCSSCNDCTHRIKEYYDYFYLRRCCYE